MNKSSGNMATPPNEHDSPTENKEIVCHSSHFITFVSPQQTNLHARVRMLSEQAAAIEKEVEQESK
jgi:hypothetical protein